MLSKFVNIKAIKVIDVKSRPVDGDGDGKYTSNPSLGDVTPMPVGLAIDAAIAQRPTPELEFISDQYRDGIKRRFPNARFRRTEPSEPQDRWGRAGLGFWKVDAGTGDVMDDLFVGQSLTRSWASDALTPSSSETGRNMDLWRSGFGESASIRAIAEGRTDLPPRFDNDQFRAEAQQLVDAVRDGAEFGVPSYRVAYAPDGIEIGSTMDLPIASVAFSISDAYAFELSDVMGFDQPRKDYFMFPNDARGLMFDDSDTFMRRKFQDWPVEGIVSGKFRVVGKKQVEFRGPLGKQEIRDVWVLDIVDDRVSGPDSTPKVVVEHRPDLVGQRVLGNTVTQPSGAPIRGVVMDPSEVPDTLFHVSPKAQQILDSGVLRAAGSGGLGGDNRDQIVSMTVDRDVADNIADSMRLVARLTSEFGADSKDKDRAAGIHRRLQEQARSEGWEFTQDEDRLPTSMGSQLNPYFWQRESATGKKNPLFMNLDPAKWEGVSEDDIGIVEVPKKSVVDSGALVTDFDIGQGGLEEIRAYGDLRLPSGDEPAALPDDLAEKAESVASDADRIAARPSDLNATQIAAIQSLSDLKAMRRVIELEDQEWMLSGEAAQKAKEEKDALFAEVKQAITTAFEGEITARNGEKYSVKVTSINASGGISYNIKMSIEDSDGEVVGGAIRWINPNSMTVEHSLLRLDEEVQSLGLGSAFNARNEQLYRVLGMDKIATSGASGTVMGQVFKGATHWPRNGFDWATPETRDEFLQSIQEAVVAYQDGTFADAVRGFNDPRADMPFTDREEAVRLLEMVRAARNQDFDSEDRLVAGDFVRWPGADVWFQGQGGDFMYERSLTDTESPSPASVPLDDDLNARTGDVAESAREIVSAPAVDADLQERIAVVQNSATVPALRELGEAWSDSRTADPGSPPMVRYEEMRAAVETALTEAFGGTIKDRWGNEFDLDVQVVAGPTSSNRVEVRFGIVLEGFTVGEARRTITLGRSDKDLTSPYGAWVEHDFFEIEAALRDGGLGSAFNARNEALYRAMGIYQIKTSGVSDLGGFVGATHWPRKGYDWATPSQREIMLGLVDQAADTYLAGRWQSAFDDMAVDVDVEEPFASREEALQIKEMIKVALTQPLNHPDSASYDPALDERFTAGDFVRWPGAREWFQLKDATVKYVRFLDLGSDQG